MPTRHRRTLKEFTEDLNAVNEGEELLEKLMYMMGVEDDHALARILGVDARSVSQARSRGKVPSSWLLYACGEAGLPLPLLISRSLEEVRKLDRRMLQLTWVPVLNVRMLARDPGWMETRDYSPYIVGHHPYPRVTYQLLNIGEDEELAVYAAPSAAMHPTIRQGELVLMSFSRTTITQPDLLYALLVGREHLMVGRVYRQASKFLVQFDKEGTPELELDAGEFEVIGQILGTQQAL